MNEKSVTHPSRLLRLTLYANAAFSAASAMVCLLAAGAMAQLVGTEPGTLFGLGTELLAFAAFLGFLASRPRLDRPWIQNTVLVIATLDLLWVAGSVALLVSPGPLTLAGQWIVGIVAGAVADFAAFQLVGWWRIRRSTDSEPLTATA